MSPDHITFCLVHSSWMSGSFVLLCQKPRCEGLNMLVPALTNILQERNLHSLDRLSVQDVEYEGVELAACLGAMHQLDLLSANRDKYGRSSHSALSSHFATLRGLSLEGYFRVSGAMVQTGHGGSIYVGSCYFRPNVVLFSSCRRVVKGAFSLYRLLKNTYFIHFPLVATSTPCFTTALNRCEPSSDVVYPATFASGQW